MEKKYPLFSNGTEFMMWQSRNCEQCVKAVFYNVKKDYYPKYRCAIQKHIEEAAITDGTGNQRDYNATHSVICPYRATERTPRKRKAKTDKNQLQLF
jgi:hypothetical protein